MKKKNDSQNDFKDNRLSPFDGLTDKELGELYKLATIKQLGRGEYLIREGETDQTAFVILDGVIQVVKDIGGIEEEIATLGQGDWVGEIAFTQSIQRTASAVARTPSSVMVINRTTLDALNPETQLYFYRKLNDLAARRVADLSARETALAGSNTHLVDYIQAKQNRNELQYQESQMIKGILSKVPQLPAFATELAVKLLDENATPNEISKMVKEDPSLVALVLKTVNSPYYGLPSKIADIHRAIVLLGFNEVYQLVMTAGLRRTMPDTAQFRALQRDSVAVSHLAFSVSQESGVGRPVEAATVGLLHNLGYCVIQLLKDKNVNLAMLIDSLDAAEIGSLLLGSWNMPESVCLSVKHHLRADYSPPSRLPLNVSDSIVVLYMARLFYGMLSGESKDDLPLAFFNQYASLLGWPGLTPEEIIGIKLLPALNKKINTFPASFRKIIKEKSTANNKNNSSPAQT